MSTVQEIEDAIGKLPPEDLAALRAWFAEFDAAAWDRQPRQKGQEPILGREATGGQPSQATGG